MDRSFIGHHDKNWYDILYDIGKQNKKGDSVIVCNLEIKFKKRSMAIQSYQASGIGKKSPVQPFFPAICKKIPSEPLAGRPRSARLYKNFSHKIGADIQRRTCS